MAATAILNLLFLSILVTRSILSGITTILQNFIYQRESVSELLLFVQKSNMAAAAILNFMFVQYFGECVCRTRNLIHVPNFVQIYALVNNLWAISEIQNGSRRNILNLLFLFILVKWSISGGSCLLQNFIHLRQSAAELLLFVQKSKMAAAAILNYNFVMLDHPRRPFVHLKFPSKFRVDRMRTF